MSSQWFLKSILASTTLSFLMACSEGNNVNDRPISTSTSMDVIETIMAWWPGDYNNDAEIAALREDGAPIWRKDVKDDTFGGHLPVNSYYRAVDMPAFGEHVLYLEEFTFKENPYRQRIYTIIENKETDEIRVKLWYFPDKTTYAGAWKDVSIIKDLTPEDLSPLPDNCDLYVKGAPNGRIEMKMPRDQCKFGSSIFDYQVSLGPDQFWFRDRIVDAETMQVKSTAGSFQYHKLDKIDP